MAVSTIHRTASVAWSPLNHNTVLLAAGTAAHQVDASFSTSSSLEIFEFNPGHLQADLPLRGSVTCKERVYKLVWSPHSSADDNTSHGGILIAGIENGVVLYSADAVLSQNQSAAEIKRLQSHTGAVHALDLSSLMPNLVASGSSESEINIYDLNRADVIPSGPKSYPLDEVTSVSWNRKIGHIYASSFSNRCVLWDLRKGDSIMKLQDSSTRTRYRAIEWNPDIATQLALASDDDHYPCVQIWDLRNASSALKTLEGHTRGILSVGWCPHDSSFLISAAKDGLVYGWNVAEEQRPEVVYALPQSKGWPFEVSWSPRIPSVFAVSSSDNQVKICDILGGAVQPDKANTAAPSNLEESFPGMQIGLSFQNATPQPSRTSQNIRKAPKWLRRPGALSFSLDGKLVRSFSEQEVAGLELSSVSSSKDRQFVEDAYFLDQCLGQDTLLQYCELQAEHCSTDQQKLEWEYVKAFYDSDPLFTAKRLLGMVISASSSTDPDSRSSSANLNGATGVANGLLRIPKGNDAEGAVANALVLGDVTAAVNLCLTGGREAEGLCLSLIGSEAAISPSFVNAREIFFASRGADLSKIIHSLLRQDAQSLLNLADSTQWREIALLFANYFPPAHFRPLIYQLSQTVESSSDRTLCAILSGNLETLAAICLETISSTSPSSSLFASLHHAVQKVLVLSRGVFGRQPAFFGKNSVRLLTEYCLHLAAHGESALALRFANLDSSNSLLWLKKQLQSTLPPASHRPLSNKLSHPSVPSPFEKRPNLVPTPAQNQYGNSYGGMQPTYNSAFPALKPVPQASGSYPGVVPPPIQNTATQPTFYQPLGPPPSPMSAQAFQNPHLPTSFPSYPPRSPSTNLAGSMHNRPEYQQGPPASPFVPSTAAVAPPPPTSGQYYDPTVQSTATAQPGFQDISPRVPSYQYQKPATGWNDPPSLSSLQNRRSTLSQDSPSAVAPAPISQPFPQLAAGTPIPIGTAIIGPPPPTANSDPSLVRQHSGVMANMMPNGTIPAYQHNGTTLSFPPLHSSATSNEVSSMSSPVQQTPAAEKPPIPSEYLPLSEGFAALFERTKARVSAQMDSYSMRRVEDVSKKLENLNDCLRHGKLSSTSLSGLSQTLQCVQNGDYGTGLQCHAALTTQCSFLEVGSFLPAIKILLQLAQRYG
ncbi:hypothetical protein RvY_09044 [Ramazzottius varieornatus]|uniref:Uncharacterized protein n=1 Tax=Ramazzottius varieornatus TaxID=947166 RepID=A0A1D1VFY2_RAMVA|nr:hypothetical protein RvY_09044 [Ramazzottius varieornatus]